ncbi:MAG: hypothetical protein ACRCUY_09575 [Thermoguttaceae bacterium]
MNTAGVHGHGTPRCSGTWNAEVFGNMERSGFGNERRWGRGL